MTESTPHLRDWAAFAPEEQTALRVEYGHWLDSQPPTCSMETKIERFRTWLREAKGVDYRG